MTLSKSKNVMVRLSGKEAEMLQQVVEAAGCNFSELIRELIRGRHSKMFPAYRSTALVMEKEQLTPEQLCVAAGGIVGTGQMGNKVCVFQSKGGMQGTVDIEYPEKFKGMAERMGIKK